MTPVDTVVFDLGGVLIDWDPRHLYRRLFTDESAMEEFLATVCTPAWNAEQDRGRPFAEAVADLSARHPEHADLIAAYHERWEEMLAGAIPGSVALLEELRDADVRLLALTNWSGETFPVARERYGFLDWFDGIVVSGHERAVKPDTELFARLCRRFDVEPARALFIDDSPANVEAAARLGFRVLRFTSPEGLRADLADLGLVRRVA